MGQQYKQRRTIFDWYVRIKSNWRNWNRRLFVSPLEVRFVRIMRGHVLVVPFIQSWRTGFPLAVIWRGKILRRELVRHQVRAGSKFIDFAVETPFYKRGIELVSKRWHGDVVAEQERDDYLKAHGWEIRYITSKHLAEPKRLF